MLWALSVIILLVVGSGLYYLGSNRLFRICDWLASWLIIILIGASVVAAIAGAVYAIHTGLIWMTTSPQAIPNLTPKESGR